MWHDGVCIREVLWLWQTHCATWGGSLWEQVCSSGLPFLSWCMASYWMNGRTKKNAQVLVCQGTVLVYACCPGIDIDSTPFHPEMPWFRWSISALWNVLVWIDRWGHWRTEKSLPSAQSPASERQCWHSFLRVRIQTLSFDRWVLLSHDFRPRDM